MRFGRHAGNETLFSFSDGTMNAMKASRPTIFSLFDLFDDEYLEIKSDLNQMKALLHDAIYKLTENFESLGQDTHGLVDMIEGMVKGSVEGEGDSGIEVDRAAKHDEDEMMDKMGNANSKMLESMNEINRLGVNINAHVGKAVTYLQFEDLTRQLIGKISKRADKMKRILIGIKEKKTLEEMPELDTLTEAKRIASSVGQKNMDSGSIELF